MLHGIISKGGELLKLIKEAAVLKSLNDKKSRDETGLFAVEGEKLVKEAISVLEFVVYSKDFSLLNAIIAAGIKTIKVPESVMEKISLLETPPGIIGAAKMRHPETNDITSKINPLILIASEIQDPGNLGTMLRIIDAVNGAGIISANNSVDHYNPKVVRGSMGSVLRVPVVKTNSLQASIKDLKKKGIKVIGTDLSANKNYWDADMNGPSAILIGNESAGLKKEDLKLCDETVKIPIPGHAESLNAAVAASLILYEAIRQRTLK